MFYKTIKISIYYLLEILLFMSYLGLFIGIYIFNPRYLENAIHILELIIVLFLLYKFHPFHEAKLEKYDQQIIFLSGTILLTNMGINKYLLSGLKDIKKDIKPKIDDFTQNVYDNIRL